MKHPVVLSMLAAALLPLPAAAQGYRARLDTRFQSVAFRGVQLDSVPAADVVTGPDGGLFSPDGFAVQCLTGQPFCTFFRPGAELRAAPVTTTADVTVWGLGVPGLTARGKVRVGADLGDGARWPGTDPAVHLLEGYAEWASPVLTAHVGRTNVFTRFGFTGFDGAKVEVRPLADYVRLSAWGGWGLARGVALPVTSDALNPLDDFQPRDRQLVAGARLGWTVDRLDGSFTYQREVDPASDLFVSERIALEGTLTPFGGLVVSGGADYDLSFGYWGTAEGSIRYAHPSGIGRVRVGARRYRPHFDLWTIWGAFSPTPYRAVSGAAAVTPVRGLDLRGSAEVYEYDETGADTPLARFVDDGWRWAVGATVTRLERWTLTGEYHAEQGPGAGAIGFETAATYQFDETLAATARLGTLKRPLEFRVDDASVWVFGLRIDYHPVDQVRLNLELQQYDETRRRPDAARFEWNQFRLHAGMTLTLGSGADARSLHPAILAIPEAPVTR